MNPPKKILVVVDSSTRHTPALHRAVELARRSGASVHLLMPVFDARIEATAELVDAEVQKLAMQQFSDQRLHWLSSVTAELVAQGLRASCEVLWAPALHDAVLARVIETQPDLVVKDLERERLMRRWSVIRPADWKLARLCPAPLMLVQTGASLLPRRIAAAVELAGGGQGKNGLDDRLLQTALPLAMVAGAEINLLHVFPYRAADEGFNSKLDAVLESLRCKDAEAFDQFAARHSVPQDRRRLLEGDPALEIQMHVEDERVDLLVLGTVHRGAFERFLLGSNAETLLAHAVCDILLIKPEGFLADLGRHKDLDALQRRYGAVPAGAEAIHTS